MNIIKLKIPVFGDYDEYYYHLINTSFQKCVDSITYNRHRKENPISKEFAEFLYQKLKWHTKEEIDSSTVEFISLSKIENIGF